MEVNSECISMTEETPKKGFLRRAAGGATKKTTDLAGKVAGGAIETAKNQAKAKATEYVVKQAKEQAEKSIRDKMSSLGKKK